MAVAGGIYDSGSIISYFPMWTLGTWNKFCLKKLDNDISLSLNSKEILMDPVYDNFVFSENIRLMNHVTDNTSYPMQGEITNLHVWDRIILPTEENTQGNILSWQNASFETNQKVSEVEFVNKYNVNNANKRNFSDITLFCMNQGQGKKIAVALDKKMLQAMQNSSRYLFPNQDAIALGIDDDTFFTGHIKYSNKWIDFNTGQEMPLNEFKIEGEFKNVVVYVYRICTYIFLFLNCLGSPERFGSGPGGCLAFNLEDDILSEIPCARETIPICMKPVTPMVKLVLEGHF